MNIRLSIAQILTVFVFVAFTFPAIANADLFIGPGTSFFGNGTDGGTPTNVDRTSTGMLPAGDYEVTEFNVRVSGADGVRAVVPFLATGIPNNYIVVWVGPGFVPMSNGVHQVCYDPGSQLFSLIDLEEVFAGFDSDVGPLVEFQEGGSADHKGTPGFGDIFVGQNLTNFNIIGIDRAYSFDLHVKAIILGDVNLDGEVDLLDVAPFVDRIISGKYQIEADTNQDGVVDLLDVQPFVDLLTG